MSFGEFLIERGHITRKQLIQGWIEQESIADSPAKIAFENSLVPEDQLVRVLDLSARTGQSFRESCVTLNLWTQELNKKLTQLSHIAKLPIGQILVKQRSLPLTQMVSAFEEYLKNPNSPVGEYCLLFGDNERAEISEIVDALTTHGTENSIEMVNIIHQCRICFLAARNLAIAADSLLAAELYNDAAKLLQALENASREQGRLRPTDFKRVAAVTRQVLTITQNLQQCLRENGTEKNFLEKEERQQRHQLVTAWLHLLIQNLEKPRPRESERSSVPGHGHGQTSAQSQADAANAAFEADESLTLDSEMNMLVQATLCQTPLFQA
jgi:hypothetical protein